MMITTMMVTPTTAMTIIRTVMIMMILVMTNFLINDRDLIMRWIIDENDKSNEDDDHGGY